MDFLRRHLVASSTKTQDAMTLFAPDAYSGLLSPEQWLQIGEGEAFLSHGAPLEDHRYISTYLGKIGFKMFGSDTVFFWMKVYVNTPIPPPAGCPTCAKVTSMIPEISVETGRVN